MTRIPNDYDRLKRAYDAKVAYDHDIVADAHSTSVNAALKRPGPARCGLCRRLRRSPRAFVAGSSRCISCNMRGLMPKIVVVERGMVGRWRRAMLGTQQEMAKLCGWSQPRQHVVDNQPLLRGQTAQKLATAIVMLGNAGRDCQLVASEWPLYAALSVVREGGGPNDT